MHIFGYFEGHKVDGFNAQPCHYLAEPPAMTYPASDQPLLVPVAPACSGLFPVSRPSVGRFLLYGNICLDCDMQVQSFPEEDSATRAQSYTKKTGGNCANSCRVLAQLLADTPLSVSSLGVIPDRGNPDAIWQGSMSTLCS